MACSNTMRKVLLRRAEESQKGTAVDMQYLSPNKDWSVLVYLWLSESLEGRLREKLVIGEPAQCFVAYDYFDFRLWGSQPVRARTVCERGILSLAEQDASGAFVSTFYFRSPCGPSEGNSRDCHYDGSVVAARRSGTEQIRSHWFSDGDKAGSILTIAIDVKET